MDLGEYLKHLREQFDLTLREVEERTGISNAYISQIENGIKDSPHIKILKKLADVYNISLLEMLIKAGYLDSEDLEESILKLPNCPYCKTNDWRFLQFGITTNYFSCNNCHHISPPKKTKQEAVDVMNNLIEK